MTRFTDAVAVVTGARGEIGAAVAEQLAREGAAVVGVDLGFTDGFAAAEVRMLGVGSIREVRLDVTDSAAVTDLFAAVHASVGPVTLLVNAAGGPGRSRTPVDGVSDEDWHRVVTLNLDGLFYCCREAARSMKAAGVAGSIVNVSSGAGRTSSRTGVQAYAAAKAGVIGLTRQLARELGAVGIRVNCVAPGLIAVEGLTEEFARITPEAMEAHLSGVALGRLGAARDLVGPITFFLGPDAAYVTGQTISVDGGSTMLG